MITFEQLTEAWEKSLRDYLLPHLEPEEVQVLPALATMRKARVANSLLFSSAIYNMARRRVEPRPRTVHCSSVYQNDTRKSEFEPKLSRVLRFIKTGDEAIDDPAEMMRSRTIEISFRKRRSGKVVLNEQERPTVFQDYMLYEWNIHHFHIEPGRGKHLLFAYFTKNDVYVIKIGNHREFSDPAILELVKEEWPGLLPRMENIKPESKTTPEELAGLRSNNINCLVGVAGGTIVNLDDRSTTGTPVRVVMDYDGVVDRFRPFAARLRRNMEYFRVYLGGEPDDVSIGVALSRSYCPTPKAILIRVGDGVAVVHPSWFGAVLIRTPEAKMGQLAVQAV